MKKILIFSLAALLLSVYLLNKKTLHINNQANAYSSCPAGVTASSANPVIVNKTGYGVGYNVYTPKSLNINRVRLSFGEGSLSDLANWGGSSTIRWAGYKEYAVACDYPTYALLYSSSGTNYLCFFHSVKAYNEYTGWSLNPVNTTSSSVQTFDANTLGGTNIVGGLQLTGDLKFTGLGGDTDNNDYAKFTVGNSAGVWSTVNIWGDRNINDDTPDWGETINYNAAYMAPGTRNNKVNLTVYAPAKTYVNGVDVSSQFPANINISSFPSVSVFWRPAVCNQPPTPPIPPDACPTGYLYNERTFMCYLEPNTASLQGRVFVDSNNNLLRTNSEANDGSARILRYNDTPQVLVRYKLSTSGSWIDASNNNSCGQPDGPFRITGLAAGRYDLQAYVNVGDNWVFSEPSANTFTIIPWPTNGTCTFADGQKITGDYCTKRNANGFCTEVTILNNAALTVTSGNTLYVWFGVRDIGPTPTPTPTVIPHSAWFQVQGGDLYADGNITNPLPEGEKLNDGINNQASAGTSFYNGSLILSEGEKGRNANSSAFYEVAGYADIKRWFVSSTFNDLGSGNSLKSSDLDKGEGSLGNTAVYVKEGNTTVTDFTNFPGNAVIFIDGDLIIDSNITVADGAFLGFIVSGNISVNSDANPEITKVQGFYFTDGTFSTGAGDKQVTFSGTIVANSGVDLERDLGEAQNPNKPAEIFEYRPDFSFSAPPELRRPYRYYRETPG